MIKPIATPSFINPQPANSEDPRVLFISEGVVLPQHPHFLSCMQGTTHDSCQHLKECAVFCWVHFSTIYHQMTLQVYTTTNMTYMFKIV